MPKLTISIPTFNRNEVLNTTLARLLSQLTNECVLHIIDNASPEPVRIPGIVVTCNPYNIGAVGNILRCIENCNTEYIWLLGDDDLVTPNAVNVIMSYYLNQWPDIAYWNFTTPILPNRRDVFGRGLPSFVDAIDSWSNILFMSANICKTELLQKSISIGYHYGYSYAGFIAMLLNGMTQDTKYQLCNTRIIEKNGLASDRWSCVNTALGFPTLLEVVKDKTTRDKLAQKILPSPSSEQYIVQQLALMALENRDLALFLYDTINARLSVYSREFPFGCRSLVKYPKIGLSLMDRVYRIVKGGPMPRKLIPWKC